MYKKLHWQFTLFSTFCTGIIAIIATLLCLFFSENSLRQNDYLSFINDVNSMITHMEGQNIITHEWLSKMEAGNQFCIRLYDGGTPLFYNILKENSTQEQCVKKAISIAKKQYSFNILSGTTSQTLSKHTEFSFRAREQNYYASAIILPKNSGHLNAVILYSTKNLDQTIFRQRLWFFGIDLLTFAFLFLFSWFFTGKIIKPLEESRKKQNEFIAAASHELRAPLSVMLSGVSALEKAQGTEAAHFRKMITSEGQRMSKLIGEMLTLANSDAKSWKLCFVQTDADTILLDVYEKFESLSKEKNRYLHITLDEEYYPAISCDAEKIEQVLSIFVDNALSYIPEKEHITLCLSIRQNKLVFCVADTGAGVPSSEKERIFDRFYRSEHSHTDKKHFGLGLCIAKEIIEQHKGTIWVEDNVPHGAKFCFSLPVTEYCS